MLRNGEKMISVRMLPGQLARLESIVADMQNHPKRFWHSKVTRSAAILWLIEREAIRIDQVARLKAEAEAAQKSAPKPKKKGKVKS